VARLALEPVPVPLAAEDAGYQFEGDDRGRYSVSNRFDVHERVPVDSGGCGLPAAELQLLDDCQLAIRVNQVDHALHLSRVLSSDRRRAADA
jgi:hypothetical protein